MDIGMLWYDDSRKSLSRKISEAAKYYAAKYHRQPSLCFINPADAGHFFFNQNGGEKAEIIIGAIKVRRSTNVRPNNFWIGLEEGVITT